MCAKPSIDGYIHQRCKTVLSIDRLVVSCAYEGVIKKLLKTVKYASSWAMLEELVGIVPKIWSEEAVIVDVPMYPPKERLRGFNQALYIAKVLAGDHAVTSSILSRVRATEPMFGLSKRARRENVSGAIKIKDNISLPNYVILVDDVWTTGSTMRECAKVLKRRGVQLVEAYAVAR